ncbi:A/G-specific adenine glycosylase [bacterium]|nr:A/G-specific adenine glycosylase [bacterium]MBR2273548.1 A/G-specific adenine glycosylase [Alphaproteobacteria bacterium]
MVKANLSQLLLAWYQCHGRNLPWRFKDGAQADPYVILVSEFMLQQTTVKTVIPYFHRFMARFPTVQDLARAPIEEVYQLWQGLGYYNRARSLHATAQMIVYEYGGIFPSTRAEVLKLKGIGPYTVASFLALAFNQPETVIDGNVMRIITRFYHLSQPIEQIKGIIYQKASALISHSHAADYTSAIMDLGATICTPKKPQCLLCPWQNYCLSKDLPDVEHIPQRKKPAKKEQISAVYLIYNHAGQLLIRQRTERGLLSGLYEFPWGNNYHFNQEPYDTGLTVTHVFTHIKLILHIYKLYYLQSPLDDGFFVSPLELKNYAFSTLMKKVWQKAA